jgi:hypothetical protein
VNNVTFQESYITQTKQSHLSLQVIKLIKNE